MPRLAVASFILAGLTLGLSPQILAAEDFYKGKQIRLIVSTDAGTAYDLYARALADVLPNHIPGKPTIIVQNMAGSSGLTATGYMANVAPRDGTVIAGVLAHFPRPPSCHVRG
jgi:tripartite-type tricarboxylate transporter receptor subunit TctC